MKDSDQVTVGDEVFTVIERQRAHLPHPNPREGGRIVEWSTINEVLLANDDLVFECDMTPECTFTAVLARSVIGHQSSHSPTKATPDYDEETLRLLIRLCKETQRDHGKRGYAERVAAKLNALEVPTHRGYPWTSGGVSSLYRRYEPVIRVRVPSGATLARRQARAIAESKQRHPAARVPVVVSDDATTEVTTKNGRGRGRLHVIPSASVPTQPRSAEFTTTGHHVIDTIIRDLGRLIHLAEGVRLTLQTGNWDTAALVDKARKFDELQQLMRGDGK